MKIHPSTVAPAADERGFTLVECLVYIAVLTVLLGVGMRAFWKCWDANLALHRNTDDIVLALHAGEQWRADVRSATGPILLDTVDGTERFRIPVPKGEVIYQVVEGKLRRHGPGPINGVLLGRVESSRMQLERRQYIAAWRWDLELRRTRKGGSLRPLFVFETVTAFPTAP